MTQRVIIEDAHVTCPSCSCKFEVHRRNGQGASYAKRWKRLPQRCADIVAVWLSNPELSGTPHTKEQLRRKFQTYNLYIKEDPMNARISELLGLGILYIDGFTSSPDHQSRTIPTYGLRVDRASAVLNNGGLL